MEAPSQQLAQRMDQHPSAAMILLARLLPLSATDLGDALDDAVRTNPALEVTDRQRCSACRRLLRHGRCTWCGPMTIDLRDGGSEVDARRALADDLRATLPRPLHGLVERVVDELDDHGLLGRSAATCAAELGASEDAVAQVLDTLVDVAPPGVGAPDVVSSLLAQLRVWDGAPAPPQTVAVLRRAALLLEGGPEAVARACELELELVEDALAFVAEHLTPCPLDLTRSMPIAPITVDVVVTEGDDGELEVQVASGTSYGVVVSPSIRVLARDPSAPPSTRSWARRHVREARTLLAQLDERTALIHDVVVAAVEHQAPFIRRGAAHHRPLTRNALATRLGVHESTVSRVVAGKRLRLPDGSVRPLRDLFGGNVATKEVLRDLLDRGPARSDRVLADQLAQLGHPIARRTVAKYRAQLTARPAASA